MGTWLELTLSNWYIFSVSEYCRWTEWNLAYTTDWKFNSLKEKKLNLYEEISERQLICSLHSFENYSHIKFLWLNVRSLKRKILYICLPVLATAANIRSLKTIVYIQSSYQSQNAIHPIRKCFWSISTSKHKNKSEVMK